MEAAEFIADRYEQIIRMCDRMGRPTGLPKADQVIYYVISVRCEIDMEGFFSVFEQLLTEPELVAFITMLRELEEPELAGAFSEALDAVRACGYSCGDGYLIDEDSELERRLEPIRRRLRATNQLWVLDEKLVALLNGIA
jgi:hypothetical protein